MEKSEKSFYVIIENKKCGKFSGASPIQVAKKVASKKLKAGKKTKIFFYLDEVGGKKKRYGSYLGRKDKKTGKIIVVKWGKVMKGGYLTDSIKEMLIRIFQKNRLIDSNIQNPPYYFKLVIDDNRTVIFFYGISNINNPQSKRYRYALFKDKDGKIWILFDDLQTGAFKFIDLFDFFLNPENLKYFQNNNAVIKQTIFNNMKLELLNVLYGNSRPPQSQDVANILFKIERVLYNPFETPEPCIYTPDNLHPKIQKCVYSDLTFGILDQENTGIIPINKELFEKQTHNYQIFLIRKQSLLGGLEPIIYIKPFTPQLFTPQNNSNKFDYCIYMRRGNVMITDGFSNILFSVEITRSEDILLKICNILFNIPILFGRFERIRKIASEIIRKKQSQPQLQLQSQLGLQQLQLQQQPRLLQPQLLQSQLGLLQPRLLQSQLGLQQPQLLQSQLGQLQLEQLEQLERLKRKLQEQNKKIKIQNQIQKLNEERKQLKLNLINPSQNLRNPSQNLRNKILKIKQEIKNLEQSLLTFEIT